MILTPVNNRFLNHTNPIMAAAAADGGSVLDREYIQRCARQMVDMGLWDNLKLWIDPGLAKLRNSGGIVYVPKAYDLSGNDNDGIQATESNQPVLESIDFATDGVVDYLDCGNDASLNFGTGSFSICFWVLRNNNENTINNLRIMSKAAYDNTSGQSGYAFWGSINAISFGVNPGGTRTIVSTGAIMTRGNWYMIVGICDRAGNMEIYLNGDMKSSAAAPAGSVSNATYGLHIAVSNPPGAGPSYLCWDGKISDLRVYNSILTSTEIAAIYNLTKGRYGL